MINLTSFNNIIVVRDGKLDLVHVDLATDVERTERLAAAGRRCFRFVELKASLVVQVAVIAEDYIVITIIVQRALAMFWQLIAIVLIV